MSTSTHERHTFGYADARKSFKTILDTSDRGGLSIVQRGSTSASVVNTALFKAFLIKKNPANVHVVHEDGAWALYMPGLPLAAEGLTLDEATDDLLDALRDYAEDWEDHLRLAPNHQENWALVQLIDSASDEELRTWLTGTTK